MKEHFKIKLHRYAKGRNFDIFLKNLGINFEKIKYFPGYEIYKTENLNEEQIKLIKQREEVARIAPMRRYYLDFRTRLSKEKIEISEPKLDMDYPVVGVIDNGIARLPILNPWIVEDDKKYVKEKINPTHGTFVAGVILKDNIYPKVKIYDGAIVPDFNIVHLEEDEILKRLKKVIEDHKDIKIWNLARSIRYPVDLDCISDFGLMLDYLQKKYDILIIKSCGNGEFNKEKINLRKPILEGADSVRALVVGSCNKENKISSFSLSGENHELLEKPDIAIYGGDIYLDENGKTKVEGVISLSPTGEIVSSFGTSFATARMTRIAGSILNYKKDATPLFIKAFLIHHAYDSQKYLTGYGYLKDFVDFKKEYEKLSVFEGKVHNTSKIDVKFDNHKIKLSLAIDVEVDYYQENGYLMADVDIEFYYKGKKLSRNFEKREKFNNLKRFEFDMEEKSGNLEIVLRKRIKDMYSIKSKKLKYCMILEK